MPTVWDDSDATRSEWRATEVGKLRKAAARAGGRRVVRKVKMTRKRADSDASSDGGSFSERSGNSIVAPLDGGVQVTGFSPSEEAPVHVHRHEHQNRSMPRRGSRGDAGSRRHNIQQPRQCGNSYRAAGF